MAAPTFTSLEECVVATEAFVSQIVTQSGITVVAWTCYEWPRSA